MTKVPPDTEPGAAFILEDLESRVREGRRVLIHIDRLYIPQGRMVAILGASGSGKSTLLSLLGGLVKVDPGPKARFLTVAETDGRDHVVDILRAPPATARAHIGFIFQAGHLLRNATVSANIAVSVIGTPASLDPAGLAKYYAAFDLDELGDALTPGVIRARQVSGGEAQRIAVVRALTRAPRIILADEPTASLDPQRGEQVLERLTAWVQEDRRRTVIWATHNLHEAARYADDVIVLRGGHIAGGGSWPVEGPFKTMPGAAEIFRRWIDGTVEPEAADRGTPNVPVTLANPDAGSGGGHRSWGRRLTTVVRLAVSELFAGAALDQAASLKPWLVWATAIADPLPPSSSAAAVGLIRTFSKWPEVCFQVLLLLLIAGGFEASTVMDGIFLKSLQGSDLSHVVVDGNNFQGGLTPNGLDKLEDQLRDDHLLIAGETATAIASHPSHQVFGRHMDWNKSVWRWEPANGSDAAGCGKIRSGAARTLTSVDSEEPMLRALIFLDTAVLTDQPSANVQARRDLRSTPGGAFRSYVTHDFMQSMLKYQDGERLPATPGFCLDRPGREPAVIEIAGIVLSFPSDNRDHYDLVVDNDTFEQLHETDQARNAFQKAAVYFDFRQIDVFQGFLRKLLRGENGTSPTELIAEAGFDKIRAAIGLANRLTQAAVAISLVFLGISYLTHLTSIGVQLRTQQKPITVLRIFGLRKWELAAYFVLQTMAVQVIAFFLFVPFALAAMGVALFLGVPAGFSWSRLVLFIGGAVLGPGLLGFGWALFKIWRAEKRPFADILKQAE